ncbi:MAG: hypothetical protein LUQ16_06845 [Methanomassiliicoccales archaeon]|jgi:hypothetical protein|nr:hypothetical protein [Methanomassiliicoccales archaeon]MDD1757033.1 hypothetical protein [Methanomassiliicoccales archaeon]
MKINLLAIVGGLLGVMCILLPWTVTHIESPFGDTSSEMIMTDFIHEGDSAFTFAIVLFLLGSALALITPLGGVGQFFGWLIFLAAIIDDLGTEHTAIADITVSLGLGFGVGLVALALVFVSMIKPTGPGHTQATNDGRERFLTWCP